MLTRLKDECMSGQIKHLLKEHQMPTAWCNINADMPAPLMPPLHPETKQTAIPEHLVSFAPSAPLAQDASQEQYSEIPAPNP